MTTQFGVRPSLNSKFFAPVPPLIVPMVRMMQADFDAAIRAAESRGFERGAAAVKARVSADLLREAEERGYRRGLSDGKRREAYGTNGSGPPPTISLDQIVAEVATEAGLTVDDLFKRDRSNIALVYARQKAMARAMDETHHSYASVGRYFGGFNHTTVIYAVKAYRARMAGRSVTEARRTPVKRGKP